MSFAQGVQRQTNDAESIQDIQRRLELTRIAGRSQHCQDLQQQLLQLLAAAEVDHQVSQVA